MARALVIVVGTLAAVVLFAGAFVYTESPAFCGSCHLMGPRAAAWEKSGHAHVGCMECHAEPGMIGNVVSHLGGVKKVYPLLTGQYITPLRSEVKDALCEKCHPSIANTNVSGDIIMVHGRHLQKDVRCTDCHAGLVHRDPVSITSSPAEQDCVSCHRQKEVSVACVTCHRNPVAQRTAR